MNANPVTTSVLAAVTATALATSSFDDVDAGDGCDSEGGFITGDVAGGLFGGLGIVAGNGVGITGGKKVSMF